MTLAKTALEAGSSHLFIVQKHKGTVCAKNQHKNRDKNQPCHSMAKKEGSKQATLLREPEQAANRAPLWRAGYRANKAVFLLRRLLPSYGPGDIAWARTISGTHCCASLQQPGALDKDRLHIRIAVQCFAACDLIGGIIIAWRKSCPFTYLALCIKRRLRFRTDLSENFHSRIQIYAWQAHSNL